MNFNKSKYSNLILYILSKSYSKPNLGKTVLCTLLYFIDFNYYELYGELLTKETYIKSKKGIKPMHFNEVTNELISSKQIFFRKEPYYNRIINKYYLTIIPTIDFSKDEQEIIDFSINQLIDNNASSIQKYTLKDPPFNVAHFNEEIDCRYVFSRNNTYSVRKIKLKNK